jgi:hypothetical protein
VPRPAKDVRIVPRLLVPAALIVLFGRVDSATAAGCHPDDRPTFGLSHWLAPPAPPTASDADAPRRAAVLVPVPCTGETPVPTAASPPTATAATHAAVVEPTTPAPARWSVANDGPLHPRVESEPDARPPRAGA